MLSAVVVEGREAGQRRGLLATDAAELRHADDEGDCGALADAGNAQHEIEAAGEVVSSAARRAFNRVMSVTTMRRCRRSPTCSSRTLKRAISSSICSTKVRC